MGRLRSTVWLGLVCCLCAVRGQDADDMRLASDYADLFREAARRANITEDMVFPSSLGTGIQYSCDLSGVPEPRTIHELSPPYVKVLCAMGDSVTAGFGAKANNMVTDLLEYTGVSWSIGGANNLDTTITIPNILDTFVPGKKGPSTGVCVLGNGFSWECKKRLNAAVSGAKSQRMTREAEDLVSRFEKQKVTDEDWKMLTIWIGGNDLCAIRRDSPTPMEMAQQYRDDLEEALDYLHTEAAVKRMFVNVVGMIDVTHLEEVRGFWCDAVHNIACASIVGDELLETVSETANLYNVLLEELISSGKYDTRDDFTVVFQPFFTDSDVPFDGDKPDMRYFAPDCFHFSQMGHGVGATYLWNNLFEPVGQKTTVIDWTKRLELNCPLDNPYFATAKNQPNSIGIQGEFAPDDSPTKPPPHKSNLAGIFVGTGVGIFVVALVVAGVAYGLVRRRRSSGVRRPSEKVMLISYKS